VKDLLLNILIIECQFRVIKTRSVWAKVEKQVFMFFIGWWGYNDYRPYFVFWQE